MYGYICPDCGCHLDPGERCDCREERERERKKITQISRMLKVETNGRMKIKFEEVV